MSKYDKIRNSFFLKFSTNLDLVRPYLNFQIGYLNNDGEFEQPSKVFICPICFKLFDCSSLAQNDATNSLTLEDIPPKKLGGKPLTLTCKRCNNFLGGTRLDSKLFWNLEVEPFLTQQPNSSIDASFMINQNVKTKGKMIYLERNKFKFLLNPNSNPNFINNFNDFQKNWEINVTFQFPNKRIVLLALLRIAHLKMFSLFGYGYLLNPMTQIICRQLENPDDEIISHLPVFNKVEKAPGIYFIKSPKQLRSFLVVFSLKHLDQKKTFSVIIPGPNDSSFNLNSTIYKNPMFTAKLDIIPELDYLTDPNKILAFTEIWDYYKRK